MLVMHPSEDKAGGVPAIDLLKLLADVIHALVVAHSNFEAEVLV